MPTRHSSKTKPARRHRDVELPPRLSSGYLVRDAHRAFQRLLERRIAPYGVTRGQWYFLRVLWNADGLSQRELSMRVGMMEPTTVIALRSMERTGSCTGSESTISQSQQSLQRAHRSHKWFTQVSLVQRAQILVDSSPQMAH